MQGEEKKFRRKTVFSNKVNERKEKPAPFHFGVK